MFHRIVVIAVLVTVVISCGRERIKVVKSDGSGDFGHQLLLDSIEKFAATPESPQAFREFHLTVEKLRPKFNETIAELAELHVTFLALGPMEKLAGEPPQEQFDKLGITVWPTALRIEPREGETPHDYVARICQAELSLECKYVVPEYWPLVLASKVWTRLRQRARDAYLFCDACQDQTSYHKLLERYDELHTAIRATTRLAKSDSAPSQWPKAGKHAAAWSDSKLLVFARGGGVMFEDQEVESGAWRAMIREHRDGQNVLGVHFKPTTETRLLRSLLKDAAAAGYQQVALMVRGRKFPYAVSEYRIAVRSSRKKSVMVRDVDTIQILVQALDIAAGNLTGEEKDKEGVADVPAAPVLTI